MTQVSRPGSRVSRLSVRFLSIQLPNILCVFAVLALGVLAPLAVDAYDRSETLDLRRGTFPAQGFWRPK